MLSHHLLWAKEKSVLRMIKLTWVCTGSPTIYIHNLPCFPCFCDYLNFLSKVVKKKTKRRMPADNTTVITCNYILANILWGEEFDTEPGYLERSGK